MGIFVLFSKLFHDSHLEGLHREYKECVANEMQRYFQAKGTMEPTSEFCLNEKDNYYAYLHENRKVEHDNLMRFFYANVLKN